MIKRAHRLLPLLGLVLASAACGDGSTGPTVSAATIVDDTTSRDTKPGDPASPTTAAATTAGSLTATTNSASVPPTSAAALASTILVGWDNGVIAEHDLRTGKIVDTITTEAFPEGRFFSDLHRTPNGTVYVASGYEDSWYSCDFIDGDISVIDTDGSIDRVAPGGPPIVSPDGAKLAYLTSSDCVTDPDNEMWFVSNLDTLVVRTLATGAERSWTFPGARYRTDAPSVLRSPVWTNGAVLVMSGDRIVTVDVSSSAVPSIASGTRVTLSNGNSAELWLEAVRADGSLVGVWWPFETAADATTRRRVVVIDPNTGKEVSEITSTDSVDAIAIDPTGQHWATITDYTVVVDGRPLTLEQPERGEYLGDIFPMLVAW